MKRYWDHTEQERAKLTEEQVTKLLAYELMEKGVLVVEPLKLEEVQPVALPTRRVFTLCESDQYGGKARLGIACDTIEQAERCRDSARYILETGWNEPMRTRATRSLQIVAEELPDDAAVAASKAALDEKKRRESANAAATTAHNEACKKASEATSDVWADWAECRRNEARHQKIRDTEAEYLRMTDGDATLARAFLAKAFDADEIAAALGPLFAVAEG